MDESKRQELAALLVQREVVCCVSSLVSGLAQIASEVPYRAFNDAFGIDQDELMDLCQPPDFEEAARAFIMDDADIAQLEEIADNNGYWGDVLDAAVPAIREFQDEGEATFTYAGTTEHFTDEDEARESAIEASINLIREKVWAITTNYEWVCQTYDLDPEYLEVYEHWAVTSWLKKKLAERGEVVGDLAGFDIWGRCCTGQSLTLDSVIQGIAWELWGEE